MPKAAAFSPLQVLSPVQLVFCLILFFLPWIELSCTVPREQIDKADKAEIEEFRKETGVDPTRPIGIISQSGLQIATGKSSETSDYKKLEDFAKKKMGGGGVLKVEDASNKVKDSAPFLFLYLIALAGGLVLGFVPWASPARKFIVLGCCLGAFAVVGIQAAIGFPMERDLRKKIDEQKKFAPPGGGDAKAGSRPEDIVKVRWKIPLYLSLLLLIGAAATSMLGPAAPPPRRKRRRPRDEDDEDEDDHPRARRDYDDDDDEDDRPRRRPRRPRRDDD